MDRSTLVAIATSILIAGPTAVAQITPIDPIDFDPNSTTVEGFEGELITNIPPLFAGYPAGVVPFGHVFASGVTLSGPTSPDGAMLYDFSAPGAASGGWGLGVGFGDIDINTGLPSPTACIACDNFSGGSPLEFTFPAPVSAVGAFVEAGTPSGGIVTLEVFDVNGISLGMHQVTADGVLSSGLDTWIGVSAAAPLIAKAQFGGVGHVIDDLTSQSIYLRYGDGCPGSGGFVPSLNVSGLATPGGQVTLSIDNGLGGATALLMFGLGQTSLPVGASGCSLLVTPIGAVVALPLGGTGFGSGSVTLFGALPPTVPVGASFTMQSWIVDPASTAGASATNGVLVVVN